MGRNAGEAVSAAAKRYCWTKALPKPENEVPRHTSQKLPKMTPQAASVPPMMVLAAPIWKPGRRPMRRISMAAGIVPAATPSTKDVTGRVASDLSSPSR